ncbi:MAG: hypothetical protein ACRD1Q_07955, partial [Vicinamibacterales bacterium]
YPSLQDYARDRLREMDSDLEPRAEIQHGRWYARYGTDDAIQALDQHGGIERSRRLTLDFENLMAAAWRAVGRADGNTAVPAFRAASAVTNLNVAKSQAAWPRA